MNTLNNNISEELLVSNTQDLERIDLLRHRKDLLDGQDKVCMTMYLENGNSFRQISRLLGVSEATISRRIQKLTNHLTGESFYIYRQYRKKLNKRQKQFARDYFLTGLSLRQIAKKHQCGFLTVKNTMKKIFDLIDAEKQLPPSEFRQWLIRQYFREEETADNK
jgi:predicted DNA-binding protein YlxM (UPF0122 family)